MALMTAMDRPARLLALGAAAAGCVRPRRDDEVVVVSFDRMRSAAFGDGEGNVHATTTGWADQIVIGPRRSTAIHAKRARTRR